MSCWVVPSIAADLWGISLQQVLDGIEAGKIPNKLESGFRFVDVAPDSPKMDRHALKKEKPSTYTVVSRDEMDALAGETLEPVIATGSDEPEMTADETSVEMGDWRRGRRIASARRLGPARIAA
jgi:hypothetical protein